MEAVPEGSGVGEVMQYLQTHSENEKGVELGLTALLTLSSKQGTMKSVYCGHPNSGCNKEVAC